MSREAHGNGYLGGAARNRMMVSRSVGFSGQRAESLKPVHRGVHGGVSAKNGNGWRGQTITLGR